MSALLEILSKEPQGEGDIVHVEQGRTVAGSRRKQLWPMELDYVSGSEIYDEEEWTMWMRSGEIEGATNCGMMGHFARDCRTKGKAKGKERKKARDMAKARQDDEGTEGNAQASQDVSREDEENRTIEDTKGNAGRVQDRTQVVGMSMGKLTR